MAVGVKHVDVSALLQEVAALHAQVRSLTTVRSEIAAIKDAVQVVRATSVRVARPANNTKSSEFHDGVVVADVAAAGQDNSLSNDSIFCSCSSQTSEV